MRNKSKTYRRVVFAGKDIPAIGMDQGKGLFYNGNNTDWVFNLWYDACMAGRDGQYDVGAYTDAIYTGNTGETMSWLNEGNNFWTE